jgi:phospholipase C
MNSISRRQMLKSMAVAAGALTLGEARGQDLLPTPLSPPELSGIEHVVVVMMENRSFDHFLGWLPGADGNQAGRTYFDQAGVPHSTYHLTDYQGCGHSEPDHSFVGGRVELDNGACDGWLRAGQNDDYAIGYYTQEDLAFFGQAAPQWVTLDRYFSAIMAGSFANRMYQHAAQTDRIDNSLELSTLPTIWDRLAEAGLTGRYYFSDVPFLALWGAKYLPILRLFPRFLEDCAVGTLPQVSFVEPYFLGARQGLSSADHPFADIRNGQAFLNSVYRAVTSSPAWPQTVLVITYDEWGGFFDHVPPPRVPDVHADLDYGLLGFRVPALLISPWSARPFVSHAIFEHTSVLRLIEWRWGLTPLTVRDASANNLAEALDFISSQPSAPVYDVPAGPFGTLCGLASINDFFTRLSDSFTNKWELLKTVAQMYGWPV